MTDPDSAKSTDLESENETHDDLSGRQIVIGGAILLLLPLASLVLAHALLTWWPKTSVWPFRGPLSEGAINDWTFGLFILCLIAIYFFARNRQLDHGTSVVLLGAWFVFARIFFGS